MQQTERKQIVFLNRLKKENHKNKSKWKKPLLARNENMHSNLSSARMSVGGQMLFGLVDDMSTKQPVLQQSSFNANLK